MQTIAELARQVSSQHQLEAHPRCGRLHRHVWGIRVLVEGIGKPETWMMPDPINLEAAFNATLDEIDGRNLNDVLGGSIPSTAGLATWLMNRFLSSMPDVTEVRVTDGSYTHRVRL